MKTRAMKTKFLRLSLLTCVLLVGAVRGAESSARDPQSQLTEARMRLDELRQKYTDSHPAIVEQKTKIAALEKQVADDSLKPTREAQRIIAPQPATFSIDFPGGTISEFFDAVSNGKGVSLSVINAGDPSDLATRLPAFSLRNTNVMTAIQVLSRLLQARGLDLSVMPSDVNSVAAVLSRREAPRPTKPLPIEFESFQLAPYLVDQTIDDIVGAIHASWELNPQNDPNALQLKFHPPTSILLASGPRDGLKLAGKIISQLKQDRYNAQKLAEVDATNRAQRQAAADTAKKQFEERQKMEEDWQKSRQPKDVAAPGKK
jgi:hypothetical protein